MQEKFLDDTIHGSLSPQFTIHQAKRIDWDHYSGQLRQMRQSFRSIRSGYCYVGQETIGPNIADLSDQTSQSFGLSLDSIGQNSRVSRVREANERAAELQIKGCDSDCGAKCDHSGSSFWISITDEVQCQVKVATRYGFESGRNQKAPVLIKMIRQFIDRRQAYGKKESHRDSSSSHSNRRRIASLAARSLTAARSPRRCSLMVR